MPDVGSEDLGEGELDDGQQEERQVQGYEKHVAALPGVVLPSVTVVGLRNFAHVGVVGDQYANRHSHQVEANSQKSRPAAACS